MCAKLFLDYPYKVKMITRSLPKRINNTRVDVKIYIARNYWIYEDSKE